MLKLQAQRALNDGSVGQALLIRQVTMAHISTITVSAKSRQMVKVGGFCLPYSWPFPLKLVTAIDIR